MVAFASVDELGQYIQQTFTTPQATSATLVLDVATSLIQDEAHQHIFQVNNDSVELRGTWDHILQLPERPVIDITAVMIRNGSIFAAEIPLAANVDYRWDRLGKLRRVSYLTGRLLSPTSGYWGGDMAVVDVTYSHGYTVIPTRAKALCLAIAARVITNPDGLVRETVGQYTAMFDRSVPGMSLTDHEKQVARRFRRGA